MRALYDSPALDDDSPALDDAYQADRQCQPTVYTCFQWRCCFIFVLRQNCQADILSDFTIYLTSRSVSLDALTMLQHFTSISELSTQVGIADSRNGTYHNFEGRLESRGYLCGVEPKVVESCKELPLPL